MSEAVIQINGLVKYYSGRCVLDGVDLRIPKGCIYGLLGRNGAGKTTLIRILTGLDWPTRGETFVFGSSPKNLSAQQRGRIGYVAEGHNLIQNYTVGRLAGLCRGLSTKWNRQLFEKLIKKFNLPMGRKVKQLSMGMRAQLNLVLAMANEPELLILDDPTLGLDTVWRREFLELAIELLGKDGRTILFSSHILSDVERIADRIGIITAGKLAVDCELEELKKRIKKFQLIFPDAAPEKLPLTEIISQKTSGREMILVIANWDEPKRKVIEAFEPKSIVEIPMNLEDLFIECTAQKEKMEI